MRKIIFDSLWDGITIAGLILLFAMAIATLGKYL